MFEYGRHLGLAFQIVDDILDFTTATEQLGKPQVRLHWMRSPSRLESCLCTHCVISQSDAGNKQIAESGHSERLHAGASRAPGSEEMMPRRART